MRHARFLAVMLTINAALLATIAAALLLGSPPWSAHAAAQSPPLETGIPNAGSQRQRMVEELQSLRASVEALRKQLDSGKIKVAIANIDELKAAARADDKSK